MFKRFRTIVTAVAILGLVGMLHSQDQPDPRAIIAKAIKAHGGASNLAKFPAITFKGSGTFYGLGEGIPYTGEWAVQGTTQMRIAIESKVMDVTFKFVRVVNGDKGWVKLNDDAAVEMPKDELAEEKEKMHAGWVQTLTPLKEKAFELALVGEAKVGERPAVGVRVSAKGKRDVNLYFDKETGLLIKSEMRAKDVKANEEFTQTTYFYDYKDFQGVKHCTRIVQKKDDKRLVEGIVTDQTPREKIEDAAFAKP